MCIRSGSYSCNLDDIRKFTSEMSTEVLMYISVRVEAEHQIAVISFYVGLNKIWFFIDFTVIFCSLQDNPVFQNYQEHHERHRVV
jgi:hypothetical protein